MIEDEEVVVSIHNSAKLFIPIQNWCFQSVDFGQKTTVLLFQVIFKHKKSTLSEQDAYKREMRLEPTTYSLEGCCSTN